VTINQKQKQKITTFSWNHTPRRARHSLVAPGRASLALRASLAVRVLRK
jgi:hypothetical protein